MGDDECVTWPAGKRSIFFLTGVYTQCSETIFDDVNKVSENMSHISVMLAWEVAIIFPYSTANSLFSFNMKSKLYKSLALEMFVKKWNNLKEISFFCLRIDC